MQVHVGSVGHNVQCHIPFNGLICNWHDQLISAPTQVEEADGILPHLISHSVCETGLGLGDGIHQSGLMGGVHNPILRVLKWWKIH